ncbi:hypothetical protein RXV86_10605 [Alisedimentitalea sp. MJ-SS2]|uniref:hypothetical protein n=1 Tax=Aliisedimentitalea sp. MJ-SS2 TaxID=3049795 RepID=UPI00291064C7|nr:hypothetical protein [Alisedimentitalea sp. MJ-SS2]MDU8927834.1 hypothetical protein [Alisedimentitalea sp. MJ-SS2]
MQPLKHRPTYDAPCVNDPLRRAVERLNADLVTYLGEGQTLMGDMAQVMQAILREIDETILPRRFDLADDSGPIAHLSIASRRLVRVGLPGDDNSCEIPETTTAAAYFTILLERACKAGGPFRLERIGRDDTISDSGQSCSVQDMRDALATMSMAGKPHALFKQIEPTAISWVFIEGNDAEPRQGGTADHFDMLANLASNERRQAGVHTRLAGKLAAKPTCTILPLGDALRVIVASDQEALLLAVLTVEQVAQVVETWSTL